MGNKTNLTNGTQSEEEIMANGLVNYVNIILCSILLVCSLLGNTLVIAVVFTNKKLKTNFNYLIVNMAASDLFIPLVILPLKITQETHGPKWLVDGALGNALCKLCFLLADISPAVSVFTLVVIAVNRYISIVYPMRSQIFSRKKSFVLISVTWIMSIFLFSPYFYIFRIDSVNGVLQCYYTWSPAFDHEIALKVFSSLVILLVFVIPLVAIIVIYSLMIYKLNVYSNNIAGMLNDKQARQRRHRNKTIFYVSIVIVSTFIVLWGPFYSYLAAIIFFGYDAKSVIIFVVQFLGYSNSVINPCVYFIFLKHFRQGLKNVFMRKSRRNSLQASNYTGFNKTDGSQRLMMRKFN